MCAKDCASGVPNLVKAFTDRARSSSSPVHIGATSDAEDDAARAVVTTHRCARRVAMRAAAAYIVVAVWRRTRVASMRSSIEKASTAHCFDYIEGSAIEYVSGESAFSCHRMIFVIYFCFHYYTCVAARDCGVVMLARHRDAKSRRDIATTTGFDHRAPRRSGSYCLSSTTLGVGVRSRAQRQSKRGVCAHSSLRLSCHHVDSVWGSNDGDSR